MVSGPSLDLFICSNNIILHRSVLGKRPPPHTHTSDPLPPLPPPASPEDTLARAPLHPAAGPRALPSSPSLLPSPASPRQPYWNAGCGGGGGKQEQASGETERGDTRQGSEQEGRGVAGKKGEQLLLSRSHTDGRTSGLFTDLRAASRPGPTPYQDVPLPPGTVNNVSDVWGFRFAPPLLFWEGGLFYIGEGKSSGMRLCRWFCASSFQMTFFGCVFIAVFKKK